MSNTTNIHYIISAAPNEEGIAELTIKTLDGASVSVHLRGHVAAAIAHDLIEEMHLPEDDFEDYMEEGYLN